MKPPITRLADLAPETKPQTYARPTPKVSRQKTAKVLTAAERAAFLASRPDLSSKSRGAAGPAYSSAVAPRVAPTRWARAAPMNSSRSPSRTPWESEVSTPVLRSLTIW